MVKLIAGGIAERKDGGSTSLPWRNPRLNVNCPRKAPWRLTPETPDNTESAHAQAGALKGSHSPRLAASAFSRHSCPPREFKAAITGRFLAWTKKTLIAANLRQAPG